MAEEPMVHGGGEPAGGWVPPQPATDARAITPWWVPALATAVAAVGIWTTFQPWLRVSLEQARDGVADAFDNPVADVLTDLLPGDVGDVVVTVPDALLEAAERGYTPYAMSGVGVILTTLLVAGVLAVVSATWLRARALHAIAAAAFLAAAAAGGLLTVVLLTMDAPSLWFLPAALEPFAPQLVVQPWAPAFTVGAALLGVLTGWAWSRARSRPTPQPRVPGQAHPFPHGWR